jgi:hypothetical protein
MIVFIKDSVLATPVFGFLISMHWFDSVYKFMHFSNSDNKEYLGLQNFSEYIQWCPIWIGNFRLCTYQTRILQWVSLWHFEKGGFRSNSTLHQRQQNLEISLRSFVNPAQALSGPLLFILEETRFQSTFLSQERLNSSCCVVSCGTTAS